MIRGFAATAKGQIHYRESGEGPPLVLVHETARSSDGFSEVMPYLARQFRVIAMDTPGFGDSYRPTESPGIAGYAQSILDFFDALGLQRPHLLGFHTGAAFAAEAAARAPDRVDRLVLCGCPDFDPDTIPAKLAHHQPFEPTADGR
ncbi:MAG: alpha/beta fold hydrolase, partial [Dehalococcoidia bacterium]|nr:alpha/beta fold hydrolase [Dehalococcoidia bacterium]